MKPSLVFFGSFQHYSTKVLRAIVESDCANVTAVVTTPPPTSQRSEDPERSRGTTYSYATSVGLPLHTPVILNSPFSILHSKKSVDFFVVAGYGNILPKSWLEYPKIAPLNLHFSLLPKYRGANPAEWAILQGETETGVSLIKMDQGLDTGPIITQESLPISPTDTRETLYETLYDLAGEIIVEFLRNWKLEIRNLHTQPKNSPTPYARRMTRADGFISWSEITSAMETGQQAQLIERKTRALYGYPGVWTKIPTQKGPKRMKLLSTSIQNNQLLLNKVQIEGLGSTTFNQIKNQLSLAI